MASKIEIVNYALRRIGKKRIQDLAEPSGDAELVADLYDISRKAVLREFPWGFALKTQALTLSATTPVGFGYSFQLPSDFIRTVSLISDGEAVQSWNWTMQALSQSTAEYKRRGNELLINLEEITMEYVYNLTDTSTYDDLFSQALGLLLAKDMAFTLTKSARITAALTNEYDQKIAVAKANTAEENHTTTTLNTTYMAARNATSITGGRNRWSR